MMPSAPIEDRIGRHHSRWLVTGNTAARDAALDAKPRVAQILLPTAQPPTARLRLHLEPATRQSLRPRRLTTLHAHATTKSP
jgi:hypothetical protein